MKMIHYTIMHSKSNWGYDFFNRIIIWRENLIELKDRSLHTYNLFIVMLQDQDIVIVSGAMRIIN